MSKRIICFFTITILLFSVIINNFNVSASVVVPSDDSTHYYVYNHIDFTDWLATDLLTINNYNNLYDSLIGNDKEQITNQFISNYNNIDVKLSNSLINPNYEVDTNNINASGLFFTPILYNGVTIDYDLCNKFIGWNTSANQFFTVLFYSPSGDQIVNSSYYTLSDNLFIMSYTYFSVTEKVINNDTYLQFHYNGTLQQNAVLNSQQNIYYKEFGSDYHYFYYDDVCLFTSSYFTQINDPYKAYNLYKQGDSLSIDRRTQNFINKIGGNSEENGLINQGEIDYSLYNGKLGFEQFNSNCSTNYNTHVNQYYPIITTIYQINNYTNINKTAVTVEYTISLNLRAEFYKIENGNYFKYPQTITYKYNSNYLIDSYINNYSYLFTSNSEFINNAVKTFRNQREMSSSLWSDFIEGRNIENPYQLITYAMNLKNSSSILHNNDSYFNITLNLFLKDNIKGEVSETYNLSFDLWNNTYSDNKNDVIIDDDNQYQDFINSYNYTDQDGTEYPVDYANYVNSGGNSSSVGDITIYQNPYPYLLVDIPENEWMNKTPNLNTLLTEFKTMLSEVHDESVLKMLPETYNYLPAPFMNYMLYGVGLIVMIGIWRAITRR